MFPEPTLGACALCGLPPGLLGSAVSLCHMMSARFCRSRVACARLQGHYKRLGNGVRDANGWPSSTLAAGSGAAGDAAAGGAVPGASSAESSPAPSEVHAAPWHPYSHSPDKSA